MNILHFMEDGETKVHSLGYYIDRKFRAYVMTVKLVDPTEKYRKPADIPLEDLMNKSLYLNGELPHFSFDLDKTTYEATCEILPVENPVSVEVSPQISTNTVSSQPNGQVVVSGVHNEGQIKNLLI